MRVLRIDHMGVVVADPAAHVAQLEALGLTLGQTNENDESVAVSWPPFPSGRAQTIWTEGGA